MTPDLVHDRLIADEFVGTSSPGASNSGVGSLHAFRRAAEDRVPNQIGYEEYAHLGVATRLRELEDER